MHQGVKLVLMSWLTVLLLWPSSLGATTTEGGTVRLLVELRRPTSLEELRGAKVVRQLSTRPPREYRVDGERKRAADLRRWRVVEVDAGEVEEAKAELLQNPAVLSVHEEQIYQAALIPNDPRFAEQFGLHSEAWPVDINAPEAWDRTTGSENTVIAVVDGGVDLAHEDLRDKIWVNGGEVAGNRIDDDGNGFIDDAHGWDFVKNTPADVAIDHATHVAGITAASGNNGVGVAGVDWGARIMSVRVLGSSGFGGEAGIVEGINYAVANGAKIINLSLVGSSSQALSDAVENAYAAGVVVAAAAGNSGINTDRFSVFPVCADVGGVNMVLGVGALDEEGMPANFSNYGRCVDVSAPGKDILSARTGDRYGTMKGTSMASPFVAGVAGLYVSLKPGAAPAEVIGAITGNMTVFEGEKAAEWQAEFKGRLNAAGVVGSVVVSEPPSPQASAPEGGGGGDSGGGGPDTTSGAGQSGGSSSAEASEDSARTPRVAGVKKIVISLADRKAPDFIQNKTVPAVVERIFFSIWDRKIMHKESVYWKARARSDKPTESKLRGAMAWHKARGRTSGR